MSAARRGAAEANERAAVVVAAVVAVAAVGYRPRIAAGVVATVGGVGPVVRWGRKRSRGPEGTLVRRTGQWVGVVGRESSSTSPVLGGSSMCFGGDGRFGAVVDKERYG